MKHTDETLRTAIDAAMQETRKTSSCKSFAACKKSWPKSWLKESPARLALAKAFLAKLPAGLQASEADKALADLASRLANIAYDPVQPMAFTKAVADHVDDLREDINHAQKVSLADARATDATIARLNAELAALHQPTLADDGRSLGRIAHEAFIGAPGSRDDWMNAAAQAVASVVLAQAIRRMEAVPLEELDTTWITTPGDDFNGFEAIRARLIAAARGEAVGINGLTEAEEAKTASVAVLSKTASSTFEAHGKTWNCHTPSDPRPCSGGSIINIYCEGDIKEHAMIRCHASAVDWSCQTIRGWRYADKPDSTDWKAKYEQAEAELAALKSSQIGILRPLSEAGPVPDGCVRVTALKNYEDEWAIGDSPSQRDTHFADIRLPSNEAPEQTAKEQSKQQVPLGPEQKLQAIKDILEIK